MKKQIYRTAADASWLQRGWIRGLLAGCVIAVAVMIFAFSAQEGLISGRSSDTVVHLVIRIVEGEDTAPAASGIYEFVSRLVRKTAHFTEFALLGFFLRLLAGSIALRRPTRWCWLAGTLYACTDELHQLLVSDRAGMWQDVLLDSAGVLAGIACAYALLVTVSRVRMKIGGNADEQA